MMDITTEKDITPDVARKLREKAGLTQKAFWEAVGSTQSSGHWFETGKRQGIPRPIRILIFQRYVAGIDLDYSTEEEAQTSIAIGREVAARIQAKRAEDEAREAQRRAQELKRKARSSIAA